MTADIEIPAVDAEPSRIGRRRAAPSGGAAPGDDPDDIGTVDEKVAALYRAYPNAAYDTTYAWWETALGVRSYAFRASIWLDRSDVTGRPDAVGHAERTYGEGEEPYASRAMETAESVALGRALRFLDVDTRAKDSSG
ncbi:hypothetical protein SK224_08015 [Microbacterium sp. BG28]|uniref:hypothetical protein n=1 Tax=Microbacterium sp. BG28 TaxID=3097356 RepID=UPI002A5A59F8|nr:hypothetical protein [Microbacterium sp. BG28]MDY0829072.1 hypothetical protein [Microbacterium sp. BG28]